MAHRFGRRLWGRVWCGPWQGTACMAWRGVHRHAGWLPARRLLVPRIAATCSALRSTRASTSLSCPGPRRLTLPRPALHASPMAQSATLKAWAGKEENWDKAQAILTALAKANSGGCAGGGGRVWHVATARGTRASWRRPASLSITPSI